VAQTSSGKEFFLKTAYAFDLVGTPRCGVGRRSVPTLPRFCMGIDIDLLVRYDLKMKSPIRKHLPHEVPLWIDPGKEIYFITVCGEPRGMNQFARSEIADRILETFVYRNEAKMWFVHFGLLMADHIHLLVSFPQSGKRVQTIISKWKEWTSKSLGIQWQRDFFEHRLRRDEGYREKADYIWANPVRAGLVSRIEDWPFAFKGETQSR
jgi:putative transposase